MATQRPIKTSMRNDPWFSDLDIVEKALVLYLFTNERTTISGIYSIMIKQISFETGLTAEEIKKLIERLTSRGILAYNYELSYIIIYKFFQYQSTTVLSIQEGVSREISSLGKPVHKRIDSIMGGGWGDDGGMMSYLTLLNLTLPNLTDTESLEKEKLVKPTSIPPKPSAKKSSKTYDTVESYYENITEGGYIDEALPGVDHNRIKERISDILLTIKTKGYKLPEVPKTHFKDRNRDKKTKEIFYKKGVKKKEIDREAEINRPIGVTAD